MKAFLACVVVVGIASAVMAQEVTIGGGQSVDEVEVLNEATLLHNFAIIEFQKNDLTILLDKTSGETWRLAKGKNGPGWVPLPRIGPDEEERNDEMTRANVNRMKKEIEAQIELLHQQLQQLDKQR